jgi:hypothetical protein
MPHKPGGKKVQERFLAHARNQGFVVQHDWEREVLQETGKISVPTLGRSKLPISDEARKERKRESNKTSQRNFRHKTKQHLAVLNKEFSAKAKKLSGEVKKDPKKRKEETVSIANGLIAHARASKEAARREAGRRFQQQLQREGVHCG